jgi:cell division septation protein DedD
MRQRIVLALLALSLSMSMVAGGAQKPKPKPAQPPAAGPKDQNKTNPPTTSKPAPQATKKATVADNQWALLVGVSQYPGQIQSLGFSSR